MARIRSRLNVTAARRPPGRSTGIGILVTRPARQAAGLAAQLAALGRHADRLSRDRDPAARRSRAAGDARMPRSTRYDIAIFVSAQRGRVRRARAEPLAGAA